MKVIDIHGSGPEDSGPPGSAIEQLVSDMVRVFALPALPVSQRFAILLNKTCAVLGMDYGYVTLPREPAASVPFFSVRMSVRPACPGEITLSHLISRTRDLLYFNAPDDNPRPDYVDQTGKKPYRFIGVPIVFDGRVFGTVEFGAAKARVNPITAAEVMLVRILSGLSAGTLVLLSD